MSVCESVIVLEVFKTSDQPSAERHEGFGVDVRVGSLASGLACPGRWIQKSLHDPK